MAPPAIAAYSGTVLFFSGVFAMTVLLSVSLETGSDAAAGPASGVFDSSGLITTALVGLGMVVVAGFFCGTVPPLDGVTAGVVVVKLTVVPFTLPKISAAVAVWRSPIYEELFSMSTLELPLFASAFSLKVASVNEPEAGVPL